MCSRSHSHTPHGGITVLSGLSVLLMQPCWKWLVHREKLWPDLSDGLVRVPRSPNLRPFFGAKGAGMLPCWQSCLTDAGRHSHKHWLGEDYEKVLKQSGFCFKEVQNVKEITFKTYIINGRNRGRETRRWRRGGPENKSTTIWSLVLAAKYEVFTPGPPGQIGHIQVPQGTVKAGDCDCAAN